METPTANRDEFGGVAVEQGRDEFGGVAVSTAPRRDEFGGVPVDSPRSVRKAGLQSEQAAARREGYAASALLGAAKGAEALTRGVAETGNPFMLAGNTAWAVNELISPTGRPRPYELDRPMIPVPDVTGENVAKLRRFVGGPNAGDVTQNETLAGVANAGLDLAKFFATPAGATLALTGVAPATALTRAAQGAAGVGFAGDMTAHLPEASAEAGRLTVEGTPGEATRALLGAAGQAAFPAMIAGGAVLRGAESAPLGKPLDDYLRAQGIRIVDRYRAPGEVREIPPELDNLPEPRALEAEVGSQKSEVRSERDLPAVPGYPEPLEGQAFEPGLMQRPEAGMETRNPRELNLQREPVVSPELADAIEAVRRGYEPVPEGESQQVKVESGKAGASVESGVIAPSGLSSEDFEVNPERAAPYRSVAMLWRGKVIEGKPGDNHASISERYGFPSDMVPGFVTKAGDFHYQFAEDAKNKSSPPPASPAGLGAGAAAPPAVESPKLKVESAERKAKIDAIIDVARKPVPDIVEVKEIKGSDGKWYSPFGVPFGLKLTDEVRSVGFAYQDKNGQRYGTRAVSPDELVARHESRQDQQMADFRKELEGRTDDRLNEAYDYWMEQKARAERLSAPLPRAGRTPKSKAGKPPVAASPKAVESGELKVESAPEGQPLSKAEQLPAQLSEAEGTVNKAEDRGYYKEPSGKTVIVMPKAEYDALPEALRNKIRSYFNWSPRRKAFISKASKDDFWARQITREAKLEEMDARPAPEAIEQPKSEAEAKAQAATSQAESAKAWTPPATNLEGLAKDKADIAAAEAEWKALQAQYNELSLEKKRVEDKVLVKSGPKWNRGNYKASAKKTDIEALDALKAALNRISTAENSIRARVRPAHQRVRVAELGAIAANPNEPAVRRAGAAVGALHEAQVDVPAQHLTQLEMAARQEVRARVPDVTEEELGRMAPALGNEMMNGRHSVEEAFNLNPILNVQAFRRGKLLDALKEITSLRPIGELNETPVAKELDRYVPGWEAARYGGQVKAGGEPLRASDVARLADMAKAEVSKRVAEDDAQRQQAAAAAEAARLAEENEAATVRQMMADAADEMAKAGTKRTASEIKKELVERLEAAVKAAPDKLGADGAKRRVMIGVPGDGVFALANTKANLREVLTRAKAMSTATGVANTGQARGTSVPSLAKARPDEGGVVKALGEFVHPDRPGLNYVFSDGQRALASNATAVLEVKGKFKPSAAETPFPVEGVDTWFSKAESDAGRPFAVSTEDLFRAGRLRKGMEWGDNNQTPWVDLFVGNDGKLFAELKDQAGDMAGYGRPTTDNYLGRFNAEQVEDLARFARKMGDGTVSIRAGERLEGEKKFPYALIEGNGWRAVKMRFDREAEVPAPEETKVGEAGGVASPADGADAAPAPSLAAKASVSTAENPNLDTGRVLRAAALMRNPLNGRPTLNTWDLAGDGMKKIRQAVLSELLGRKATQAESGVTNITNTFADLLGVRRHESDVADALEKLVAAPDPTIAALEKSRDRFGKAGGALYANPLPEVGRAIWRTGHDMAIAAVKGGRSAREAIETAWAWIEAELRKAGVDFNAEQLKRELYEALKVRQLAQRIFEDADTPEEAKRQLNDVFYQSISLTESQAKAREQVAAAEQAGKLDAVHNLVATKLSAGDLMPADVALQAALVERYQALARDPATRETGVEKIADLLDAGLGKSTNTAQVMNAYKLLAASPLATARYLKRQFLGKVADAWDKSAGGGHWENVVESVRQAIEDARQVARTDPSVQAEAGKAVLDAIMAEAARPGSPLYSGMVMEVANTLEQLPSVRAKARDAVVRQWQRLGEKELVRNIAKRAGAGLENAIWGAVKKAGGDTATVQKVMAQLNSALHEQLNAALGVKKDQFANPQTYLQRLQTVLHNAEQLSRIWEGTRAAVGHNLAQIEEMKGLIERIENDMAAAAVEKGQDVGLESQKPAVRAEARRLRDAQVDERIRQMRERQADVKKQLAEYEKMAPAWRTVMNMTVDVWGGGLLRGALREQMKANEINLRKLVADHFRGLSKIDPTAVLKTLSDKIVEATGLDKPAAERLARDLEREYVAMVEKERAALRKRMEQDEARRKAQLDRIKQSRSIVDREAEAAARKLAEAAKPEAAAPKPAVQEFYQRLVTQMRRLLPDVEKPGGRKLSDLELVREAVTNADRYEDVWRRLGDELRARHGIEGVGEVKQLLGDLTPLDVAGAPFDRLLRARMREMKVTFAGILKESGLKREQTGADLRERLVNELGLTGESAQRFVDVFNRRWQAALDAAQRKTLDRLALDPKLDRAVRGEVWRQIIKDANMGVLTDERFKAKVQKRYGLPKWTPEMSEEAVRRAEEIARTPEGTQRDFKIHALNRWLKSQQGGTVLDYARELYYSNLFYSLSSWARNAGFNTSLTLYQLAAATASNPRAMLDVLRSGAGRWGAAEGLRDAASVVHTGEVTGAKLSKYDQAKLFDTWRDSQSRLKRAFSTYVSTPFRMLAAGDVPFYRFWQEMEWAQLARHDGVKKGLSGDKLRQHVADVLDYGPQTRQEAQAQAIAEGLSPKPTEGNLAQRKLAANEYWRRVDEIIQQKREARLAETGWGDMARETALFNTLNSDFSNTPLGRFGKFIASQKGESFGPMWDAMTPVVKVVVNAADLGIEATPGLNWVRAYEVASSGGTRYRNADIKNPLVARRFAAQFLMSHAAVAVLALWSASQEDKENPEFKLHGRGPLDPAKRKQLPEGWQPHSFQVGKNYYNLGWLGPLILPLDAVANYQDAIRYGEMRKKDAAERLAYAISQMPAVVLDQSGLQGLADALNFFNKERPSDNKLLRAAGRIVKTGESVLVPGYLRQLDQVMDPKTYTPQDIKQAVLSGIPWARRTDAPDLDWRGQPMKRGPFDSLKSEEKADPLGRELVRLNLWVNKPAPKELWQGVELTPAEQYEFTKNRQQRLYAVLKDWSTPGSANYATWQAVVALAEGRRPEVEKVPPGVGREAIIEAIRGAKMDAAAQHVINRLADIIGEQEKNKLKAGRIK